MILSRKHKRASGLLATLLIGAMALTACANNDDPPAEPAGDTTNAAEGYPVTIDTAYGEITLNTKPERIVVLTPQYVDLLTSIDEQPTATNPGDFATEDTFFEFYEWLDGKYSGDIDARLLNAEYQGAPEVIASYEPDLILGNVWSVPEDLYTQMSDIAPTYAGRNTDGGTEWQDLLTDLGMMTGREGEAAEAIEGYNSAVADGRSRLPGFAGRTFFTGHYLDQQYHLGSLGVFAGLGMEPAEGQPSEFLANPPSISLENIDQLTADVLSISVHAKPEGKDELEADPRFRALPAVQNGTVLWGNWQIARASAEPGPASLNWYLESVVSQLEKSPLNQS